MPVLPSQDFARRGRREARRFDDVANHDCSFITLADTKTDDLGLIRDRVKVITRCIRDLRDYAASRDKRYREVEVIGYAECDPVWRDGIDFLAPDQAQLIQKLTEMSSDKRSESDMMWVVRCHLRMRHVGISRDDIAAALRRIWPAEQVHAEPFRGNKPASEQAGELCCYSAKHIQEMTASLIDDDMWPVLSAREEMWPVSWSAQYFAWLESLKRGIQPLRVSVGPMQQRKSRTEALLTRVSDTSPECDGDDEYLEPMPIILF
jgi:hypothetical protein